MNVIRCKDYDDLSVRSGTLVLKEIAKDGEILLCTAMGKSPTGLYKILIDSVLDSSTSIDNMSIIGLDEWGGIPKDHPSTCRQYIKSSLLDPLSIPEERAILFDSGTEDAHRECRRIQSELDQKGPIDICILGIGINGHLGLNEPGPFLKAYCHKTELSKESLKHSMLNSGKIPAHYGLTLGMKDILSSKKIILLITGEKKRSVTEDLLEGKITPNIPATFLWLHDNIDCFIDENIFNDN